MNRFGIVAVSFALVLSTSCRAQAPVSSTRAQASVSSAATGASATSTVAPAAATGTSGTPTQIVLAEALSTAIAPALAVTLGVITGTVGPLLAGAPPCFADRYPCAVYAFSLPQAGSIEVTVKWEGDARALMAQLYWAGEGLAHEDVAPRNGPARIWFQRPKMEAADYRLRVVSLEPSITIPFTLTLAY